MGGLAVASFFVWRAMQKPAAPSMPTQDQKARMEEARKRQLDRLQKEADDYSQTDEWKAREQAAKDEVDGKYIKPEHRKAGKEMGRPGGSASKTIGVGKR